MKKVMAFIIWLVKIAVMLGLLVGAAYGWLILLFIHGGGLSGSGVSGAVLLLDIVLMLATLALYIFICVKISRIGTKKHDRTASFKEKATQPLMIIIPIILIVAGYMMIDPAKELITEMRAKSAVRNADEIIRYNNDNTTRGGYTILDSGLDKESLTINYDAKKVAFIFEAGYGNLYEYKLKEGEISENQCLQYITGLSSPGKTFATYYDGDETHSHLTSGLRLEMEDGSVYSAEFDLEYLDVNAYPWTNIIKAIDNSDETIIYGKNTMRDNYFGIETNTLFVDHDTNTFTVVHGNDDILSCDTFELIKTDKVEDIYLQAKIDLEIGTLYAYTDRIYDKWTKERTDGLILIANDGGIYVDDDDSDPHYVWGYWDFYNSDYRCSPDHVTVTADGIEKIN